jgi:uncharacterized protein (TIGR02996 family)
MLDRRPFIEAILEDPDDDAHRLVYADYLDEYGNESDRARAEFIRLGCEVARLTPDSPRRAELERREDELLAEHGPGWSRTLPRELRANWTERGPNGLPWRRGFPWGARVDAYQFLGAIERVLPDEVIFGVTLEGRGPEGPRDETDPEPGWLDRLVASPSMKLVGGIDLCETHFCLENLPDRFVKLIGSPHLTRLTELYVFMDYIGLPGVRAIVESPAAFRLRRLMLGCFIEPAYAEVGQADDFLEALRLVAGSPRMTGLEHFNLDAYYDAEQHQVEAADILLASEHLPRSMELEFDSLSALTAEQRARLAERFVLGREPGGEEA